MDHRRRHAAPGGGAGKAGPRARRGFSVSASAGRSASCWKRAAPPASCWRPANSWMAGAVVVNADAAALARGPARGDAVARCVKPIPGARDRSLSAVTWAMTARDSGFDLLHHNVFFSRDYRAEFDQIFRPIAPARTPQPSMSAPRIAATAAMRRAKPNACFVLMNAPADGDCTAFPARGDRNMPEPGFQPAATVRPARGAAGDARSRHRRISTACFRRRAGRCTDGRRTAGRPHSRDRDRRPRFPAFIWRAAAPIRARVCRWRHCRDAWPRSACFRTALRCRRFRRAAISGGISTASAATDALRSP